MGRGYRTLGVFRDSRGPIRCEEWGCLKNDAVALGANGICVYDVSDVLVERFALSVGVMRHRLFLSVPRMSGVAGSSLVNPPAALGQQDLSLRGEVRSHRKLQFH